MQKQPRTVARPLPNWPQDCDFVRDRIRSVETTNPVGIEIAMQVKEALESVGYQITLAEAPYSIPCLPIF